MLQMKIIEHSDSPYCSPIVIVPKKDGTNRFCIEFRLLNNQTGFLGFFYYSIFITKLL